MTISNLVITLAEYEQDEEYSVAKEIILLFLQDCVGEEDDDYFGTEGFNG